MRLLKSDKPAACCPILSNMPFHALPFVKDRLAILSASGSEFGHD